MKQANVLLRPIDGSVYEDLISKGVSHFLARLYAAREIQSADDIETSFQYLPHFSQLKNAEAAAKRLATAIEHQEKIMVVGDYDADGATACALAIRGLGLMGACVDFLLPNRFIDGYGLNPSLLDEAYQAKADLIVTVDNGMSAFEGVAQARKYGMDIIVTDHHLPADTLPECLIVNPNQPGCLFPSKNLAGVGVMFYVLSALRHQLRVAGYFGSDHANAPVSEPNLSHLLDWVALGTVADVVKLDQTNRILVTQGLKRIRKGHMSSGMHALFDVAKRSYQTAGVFDLGFSIGPRINAAGRLEDMALGVRCLLSDDPDSANEAADVLNQLNIQRRSIEKSILNDVDTLPEITMAHNQCTIAVFNPDWHQGVIGIVAGRLKESFYRPTIVFARGDAGEIKGSGRSIKELHLRDALDCLNKRHPGLMLKFGGHAMAAGLSIREDQFAVFQRAFEETVATLVSVDDMTRDFVTDGSLAEDEISLDNACVLDDIVWGQGFVPPSFTDEFDVVWQKKVGVGHSKLGLKKGQHIYEAMLFHSQDILPSSIKAVYRLLANRWRNNIELQLYVDYWEAL